MTKDEKLDYYIEKSLRYARIIRDIRGIMASKNHDVEHKEPEILVDVVRKYLNSKDMQW